MYEDMVQQDEERLVSARANFYKNAITKRQELIWIQNKILIDNSVISLCYPRSDLVEIGEAFAKTGIPLVVLSFSLTYWTYGLLKYSDMYWLI